MQAKDKGGGRKRGNGEGSFRVRGKSVEFRWTADGTPKTKSEPVEGRTKKELRDRLEKLRGQPKNYNDKGLLETVARAWYAERSSQVSAKVRRIEESSYATDAYTLETVCKMFAKSMLVDLTPADIDQRIPSATYTRVTKRKDGTETSETRHYSMSVQKKAKSMLHQIFAYAVSKKMIAPADNPMLLVQRLTGATREDVPEEKLERVTAPEFYSASEICDLVERLPHNKYGDAYLVSVGCCFRGQEMRARRDTDIEPDGTAVDVWNAVKRGLGGRDYIGLTKSEKGDRLAAVPWFAQAAARRLREGAINGYILPNKSGGYVRYTTYRQGIADALRKAGVRQLPPHKARNTYISNMKFLIGEDAQVIMSESGHSDRATMEGYAEVTFERRQAAAEKFNALVLAELSKR